MGFPSPAQDYAERRIDLNALMVLHPAATLFIPTTDRMVLVDKSMKPNVGDVVYFEAWGAFQVGRIEKHHIACQSGDVIEGDALENVTIVGKVTFEVLHVYEESRPTI
jgi:DNA polymerase V